MIVTTSYRPSEAIVARARRLASQLKARIVQRGKLTIPAIQTRFGVQDVLVVTEQGLRAYRGHHPPLFFHPGSAFFRIKRLLATGEAEPLLDVADVRPGDTIIDCTAGLCSDAIVFAHAVGRAGRVIAVEADAITGLIVRDGLSSLETDVPEVDAAMRRIELVRGHHLDVLRGMADRSVDIVYFDPMFRSPVEQSSGIAALRHYALEHPLAQSAVDEAVRVARRSVVLKELRQGGQFERLGFARDDRRNAKIAYGVIRI